MAIYTRGDLKIHYTLSGDPDGPPVLLLAPGGMNSAVEFWGRVPWNPLTALSGYRVIGMDQRNAGQSTGPISAHSGWETYAADQLELLAHLGVKMFHVIGMCIGGPYTMGLIKAAPERVISAVMLQPIGLDGNRDAFFGLFDAWSANLRAAHPEVDESGWAAFREAMFGGDFMFNTSRADVAACQTPILLLKGNDMHHPASISDAFAALAPNATTITSWKGGADLEAADRAIKHFLAEHSLGFL